MDFSKPKSFDDKKNIVLPPIPKSEPVDIVEPEKVVKKNKTFKKKVKK